MADKPYMGFKGGYNSSDANSMLSELYPAIAKTAKMGLSNMWNGMDTTSKAATVAGLVPFYGDIAGVANDARLYAENPEMRTPVNYGLSALGMLPLMPSMGTIRGIGKGLEKSIVPPVQKVAPQDEALRLAQERAALPVEQGGLGLPVDNTPQQRAMALEWDTPAYHGRVMDDMPNNEMPDAVRGGSVGHAYLTDNPDVSSSYAMTSTPTNSSSYAMTSTPTNSIENIELAKLIKGYSPTNYPLLVKSGRQLTEKNDIYDIISPADLAEILSKYTSKLDYREFLNDKDLKEVLNGVLDMFVPEYSGESMPKNLSRLFGFLEENPVYKKDLHQKFDSLIYNDLEAGGKTIVPFDKDNIRSRFAAFDPYRKSAAVAAAMGVAAPDLMADEKQKPAKKNIVPPVKKQGK